MMKRRLTTLAVVVIAVLLIAEVAGCGKDTASVADNTQTAAAVENTVKPEVAATPTREATDEFIGVEKAKELILKDLGVSEATFVERETELDDMEYEFEVIVGDKEYDYEVHAVSGAIVEKDVDRMDAEDKAEAANKAAASNAPASNAPANKVSEKITVEEAKAIILKDLGVEKADFVELDSERDDNEYEFEVIVGDKEYDYDVNFYTGKIVDKDVDHMDAEDKAEAAKKATDKVAADKAADKAATDKVADNTASEKISLEKAKEIALADLGNSNAKLVEKEFDDGKYELEFYADGVEYKYEINAKTGKIVDKEVDKDHH